MQAYTDSTIHSNDAGALAASLRITRNDGAQDPTQDGYLHVWLSDNARLYLDPASARVLANALLAALEGR